MVTRPEGLAQVSPNFKKGLSCSTAPGRDVRDDVGVASVVCSGAGEGWALPPSPAGDQSAAFPDEWREER